MTTRGDREFHELVDRIRAVLGNSPRKNMLALSSLLIDMALQLRNDDGDLMPPTLVKNFLWKLISDLVDVDIEYGGAVRNPDPLQ